MSERLEHFGRQVMSGERRGMLASLTRGALGIVEPLYAGAMSLRNIFYGAGFRVQRLARPVVSVGNITTGGTGKTPVVMWLAEQLRASGKNAAILMRGYRAAGDVGSDERRMLEDALKIPVHASPDRVTAGRRLLHEHPQVDVVLLDDGFQHRKLARDFDLVLINAAEPFGFDHVLPRGLLRESLCGLRRADAILLTHADADDGKVETKLRRNTSAPIYRSFHRHIALRDGDADVALDELRRRKFFVFAGIGDPRSLEKSLKIYGENFIGAKWFADHHHYSQTDMDELSRNAEVLVTTEKDWVKLQRLRTNRKILRLKLSIEFENDDAARLMEQITAAVA